MNTIALERLRAFRQQVYTTFGCRRDALFEMRDALLTTSVIEHPVHLSLAPGFPRTWGSIYDAQKAGTMALPRLEDLVAAHPLETPTAWYAVDESRWPRCDAQTSPVRGYYQHHTRHSHGQPIVAGWNSSWLVQIPERCSSWTAPLRVRRMLPGETINQVEALADSLLASANKRPTNRFPSSPSMLAISPVQLGVALAGLKGCALVRLRSGR